jgi:hypothetical protein
VSQQQPSEEELRAALEEQMRNIRVEDVIVQTVVTLVNLGARRLGLTGEEDAEPDAAQARMAIEGARALMPLLPEAEELRPVRDALSQLQMAYVQAEGGGQRAEGGQEGGTAEGGGADEAERAKARSKIWTPGS